MRTLFSCFFVLAACSSNDTTTLDAGGKDSSPANDANGIQPDTGAPPVNGCGPNDFVAANMITWDTPNPIAGAGVVADGGSSVTIKFSTAGTFGFHCTTHATMLGAVKVAP